MPAPPDSARPAVPLALAAFVGVVLGGAVPLGPTGPAIAAAAVALAAVARRSLGLLLAAVFLLGLARRLDARAGEPRLLEAETQAILKGRVAAEPTYRFGAYEVLVDVEGGWWGPDAWGKGEESSGPAERAPGGFRVLARLPRRARAGAGDLLPGRRLEIAGLLRPPRVPLVPGGFDPVAALVHQDASAVFEADRCWSLDGEALGPSSWVARLGRRARGAIRAAQLPRDEEAVVRAVVLGDRNGLSPAALAKFRATSMVHAITVSGIHVAALVWLLGALARPLPIRARGVAVAAGLALYLGLAGPHPGVLRASIAGALLAVAQGWGRGGDSWNRLAVALIAVLAWDPACVEESGFQLTFGTVAGILALAPAFARRARGRVRRALATSLAAFVAHAPLLAVRFGQVAPVAIVASLPALPVTTATLLLGLTGTGLGLVHPAIGRPILILAGLAARVLLALVDLAANVPPLQLPRPSPLAAAIALGLATLGVHSRRRGVLAAGVLLFLAALLPGPRPPPGVDVLPRETRIRGPFERLGEGVFRVEHRGESVLVLEDPGGRELARVLESVPEGKLRASVVVARGRTGVALERLVERTRPLVVIAASRAVARRFPGSLEGAWRITLGELPAVERYDGPR